MPDPLVLTLFGIPLVRLHGQVVNGFRSSKAQALLFFLAVTGRAHTRATLAGLFWGDQPETAARVSLSKCLSNLHELLGDAVLIERQTVAFNRGIRYQLDTEEFVAGVSALTTSVSAQSLHATLALYRGDFLEGFYVRDAPDFEQWLLGQRALYRESVMQGLHALAAYAEQQGHLPQAITHTRRLLVLEPWREEAHRHLMMLLARSGQRAAALAQFETCRRILNDELAAEPDAETLALVGAIRAGDFDEGTGWQGDKVNGTQDRLFILSPPQPVPHPLPIPPTPLIGRERDLAELNALISNPTCKLITISGPGGMGKTRLALAAAADQSKNFQHGALFVPLVGVATAQFLPQAILSALDIPLRGEVTPQQQVRTFLYSQECLLVLDNYEHLLPEIDLLVDLLHHAPRITVLVTSRERLLLQAEHLFELTGLAYPHHLPTPLLGKSAADLTSYAAIQLFLQRIRQTQPRFAPGQAEMAAIVRICQLSEGMPLALELAAAAVRMHTCQEIAAGLVSGQPLPVSMMRDRPARHQSIDASIDHSWRLLTGEEQQILRRLAVFRSGFHGAAAQTVTGATLSLLLALVDKSLVQLGRNPLDVERYALHELIRQYATEKLEAAGELAVTQLHHCQYYLALAQDAEKRLHSREHKQSLDCLEIDHDNLRAALGWALEHDSETALALAASLGGFWRRRGYISEGRDWLQRALNQCENLSLTRAKALVRLGDLVNIQGERDLALSQHAASLSLSRQLDDPLGIALALRSIGWFYVQIDKPRAIQTFEESLAIFRSLDDVRRVAQMLGDLAQLVFEEYADDGRARRYVQESLTLAKKIGDIRCVVQSLNIEAQLAGLQGDHSQEMRLYQEALPLVQELGIKQDEAWILCAITETAGHLGDLALARQAGQVSRALFTELGFKSGLAVVVHHLGIVTLLAKEPLAAKRLFCESLELSQASARKPMIARCLAGLGGVAVAQADARQAACLLSAAYNLFATLSPFLSPTDQAVYERFVQSTRTQLDESSFMAAWKEGAILPLEQVVACASCQGNTR